MEYNLVIKPKAQQDIREAVEWYREQSENLPEKLLLKKIKEVEDILLQLNVEISLKKNENNLEYK